MARAASCLLLLGGNLGDRRARLKTALKSLTKLPGTRVLGVSRVYETAPVGPSRRRYLNAAAKIETSLSPMALLIECKRLEAAAGRAPAKRWSARPLDVDILRYGARKIKTPWLTAPHPLVSRRAFALAPVCDLEPRWKPQGRAAAAALLRRLNPDSRTVKIFSHGL